MIEEVSTYVLAVAELEKMYRERSLLQETKSIRKCRSFEGMKEMKHSSSSSYLNDQKNSSGQVDADAKGHLDKGYMDAKGPNPLHGVNGYEQEVYSKISCYFDGVLPLHEIA